MAAEQMNASQTTDKSPPIDLLRQAAEWHLIGLLLQCPDDGWPDRLASLAVEVDDPKLHAAVKAAQREVTAGVYHTAFGPGGPAAPREVSHRDTVIPGGFLSDLCGFYEAFAYQPPAMETPDHVASEAGFIGYMRLKEAYARTCNDDEQAQIAAVAATRFIEEHLAMLAHRFAASVKDSGIEYLELAAESLLNRVGPMPETSGVDSPLPILDDDDSALSCGAEDAGDI